MPVRGMNSPETAGQLEHDQQDQGLLIRLLQQQFLSH